MSRIKLLIVAAPVALLVAVGALAFGLALPVAADPASTADVTDFETQALDAAGQFKQVECSSAHQTVKGDKVTETYACEFLPDSWLGAPALPTRAMHWDYESSTPLVDVFLDISGPYRWFSDIEHILTPDDCFWFSNDWRMVITPAGDVNVSVVYDPVDLGAGC